jgi:hypothetical protein
MHENFLSPYRQSIHRRDMWRVLADELVLQEMIPSADKVWKILAEQIHMTEDQHMKLFITERKSQRKKAFIL